MRRKSKNEEKCKVWDGVSQVRASPKEKGKGKKTGGFCEGEQKH
jgi:hypothetical protein